MKLLCTMTRFYTDQDTAMAKVEKIVITESYHGLCTFHIMQDEEHILSDFSACMYDYEDKEAFQEAHSGR